MIIVMKNANEDGNYILHDTESGTNISCDLEGLRMLVHDASEWLTEKSN